MKIIRTRDDKYYNEKSRFLGNCYNFIDNSLVYHYEFKIKYDEATIFTDNPNHLEEVITFFRKFNKFIPKFKTEDGSFYKAYDEIATFKLPINILQVSQFFLDKQKLDEEEKYIDINTIVLPVKIIDDEYVLLNGHHRLYRLYKNDIKMVEVYLDEELETTRDFVYIAKEKNIRTIKDLAILEHKEYENIMQVLYNEK